MTTDKAQRKERPIARGVLDYFPDAIAEIAHVSFVGNQQHNPGQEMHWAKDKSPDHADCILRHLIERGTMDTDGLRHSAKAAWRALALLQIELDQQPKFNGVPIEFAPCTPVYRFDYPPEAHQSQDFAELIGMGCPEKVARQIVGGMTYSLHREANEIERYVYIAGPMRGFDKFNFPAFDAARDEFLDKGFNVISPADIDRAANPEADQVDKVDVSDQTVFVIRDFWANVFLKRQGNTTNGIVLLDGWQKSTGATGEFFLDRWLGLKAYKPNGTVYDADAAKHDYALAHSVMKIVTPKPSINPVNPASPEDGDWDTANPERRGAGWFFRVRAGEANHVPYKVGNGFPISPLAIDYARKLIAAGAWTRLTEADAAYLASPNR